MVWAMHLCGLVWLLSRCVGAFSDFVRVAQRFPNVVFPYAQGAVGGSSSSAHTTPVKRRPPAASGARKGPATVPRKVSAPASVDSVVQPPHAGARQLYSQTTPSPGVMGDPV